MGKMGTCRTRSMRGVHHTDPLRLLTWPRLQQVPVPSQGACSGGCRTQKTLMSPIPLPQGARSPTPSRASGGEGCPYLSLHSQVESPTLEGQHGFVLVPGAFRENPHSELHRTRGDGSMDPTQSPWKPPCPIGACSPAPPLLPHLFTPHGPGCLGDDVDGIFSLIAVDEDDAAEPAGPPHHAHV